MKYIYPIYYKDFQCIAGACEETCCAGWEIVIDDESIDKYLHINTKFGNRLCSSIDFEEGVFHQDDRKRCAFLNQENLCDIYSEIGEEYLCYTCKQYPRHIEEFECGNEVSLSISCPEVAKMILEYTDKVTFYEEDIDQVEEEYEDFDFLFYEMLYDVRTVMFRILQNREKSIRERMDITAELARAVQEKIDTSNIFEIPVLIGEYEGVDSNTITTPEQRYYYMRKCIKDLYRLEVLRDDWRPYLDNVKNILYKDQVQYVEEWKLFQEQVDLEQEKEQLMIYFIYSYLCGAVYDGEMKVKYEIAHTATNIIEELWFAKWKEQSHELSTTDKCKIVYKYAREIEHSDMNLEELEQIYTEKTYR